MEKNFDSVKKGAAQNVAKAVRKYVTPSIIMPGWPPVSTGLYYQAKRPTALRMDNDTKEDADK